MNEAMVAGLAAPTMLLFDGILYRLSEEERDAIIAHELAHLANHSFWYWLVAGGVSSVATVVAAGAVAGGPVEVRHGQGYSVFESFGYGMTQ